MIRVTSTALNAGVLAHACIESVRQQTFTDWTHDYIDALSADDTYEQALAAADNDPRVRVRRNTTRNSVFGNLLPLWRSFADDDIIVWVDGDDRLAVDTALATLFEAHKKGAMVTYGQFMWPDGTIGTASQVGPDPRSEQWRATHLKTFRAGLLKRVRDEDLRVNGEYSNLVTDQPIMLALLEMVPERAVFIPKVLHVYNENHSHLAKHPEDLHAELAEVARIRSLPRYKPLNLKGPLIAETGFWDGKTAHLHHDFSMELAEWIADYLPKDSSVYDFGCGVGSYLKILQEKGFDEQTLWGLEGSPPEVRAFKQILQADLTKTLPTSPGGNVICLEVAEHIPPEFEDVFLDNITSACSDRLILSWAVRGQGGDGHVNCLDNHEVISRICKRGFRLDQPETASARSVITDHLPWFKDTLLIFEREIKSTVKIPKILHQIWIGPKPAPIQLMNTWKDKHPDWEYRLWTDEHGWENQAKIDAMPEWNGKADIMRYEILEKFGGVLVDADSECIQKLDDEFLKYEAFACWEHEVARPGLIATGYVGAIKNSELMRACIDAIKSEELKGLAWESVGPLFFTRISHDFKLHVFPGRMFIPEHYSGVPVPGDSVIYAKQFWGSTVGYDKMTTTTAAGRKLEIGAGPLPTQGYEHNDLNPGPGIDHVGAIQDLEFPAGTFVEVYGNGAFEHLTYEQAIKFLKKALQWLTPGGVLNINTPDMMGWVKDAIHESKDPKWIKAAFEGWCRWPGDEHKSFWTEPLLVMALHEVGFEKIDVYQRWAYAGPEDWHICVKAYKPAYPIT